MKIWFTKKQNKTKQKDQKKKKKFQMARVGPQSSDVKGQLVTYCAMTTDNTNCC